MLYDFRMYIIIRANEKIWIFAGKEVTVNFVLQKHVDPGLESLNSSICALFGLTGHLVFPSFHIFDIPNVIFLKVAPRRCGNITVKQFLMVCESAYFKMIMEI